MPIVHGLGRILALKRLRRAKESLQTVLDRLLRKLVEDRGLFSLQSQEYRG